jgi:hypothetical protein
MDNSFDTLFGNSSSTDRSAKRRKKANAQDNRRVEIGDFSQLSVSTLDGRLTVDVTDNVLTLYFKNTVTLAVYERVIRESDLSVFDTPQLESVDFLSQILLDALQKSYPAIVSCTVELVKDTDADSIHIVVSNKFRYAPYNFTLNIPRKTLSENTENKLRLEKVLVENETLRQRLEQTETAQQMLMTRLEEISNDVQYMRFLERERHGIGLHALMGQTCNGARRKEKVNHHTREHMVFHNTLNPLTIEYYNKQHDTILKSYHVVSHPFPKEVENGVLHLTPFTQYRGHRLVNGNYRLYAQNLSPMYTDSKRYQCDIRKHNGGSEREVCVEVTLKVPAFVYTIDHDPTMSCVPDEEVVCTYTIPRKLNNTKWVMRWSKDMKQWLLEDKYVNQFTEEYRPHEHPSDSNYHIIKRRATFLYWSAATLPPEWRAQGVHHEYKVLANEDDEEDDEET